jgi:nickel superoxide dismutase
MTYFRHSLTALAVVALMPAGAWSHCQIPCGIYGDSTRFELLAEHIATIEKSMQEITRLSAEAGMNHNQLVRWVNNKEQHADELSRIITHYFMAQRVKPIDPTDTEKYRAYQHKLTLLHKLLVHTMKSKQTTDSAHITHLRSLLADFRAAYFSLKDE